MKTTKENSIRLNSNPILGFLKAQWAKNQPSMQDTQEMRVQSPGQEDPSEEEMATHSSILA